MATFKCKMCGGTLEINNSESVAVCEYCGTQQQIPNADDEHAQTSPDNKKVKISKFKRMVENFKRRRQEKKKYCLVFPLVFFSKSFCFLSVLLYLYFGIKVLANLDNSHDALIFSLFIIMGALIPSLIATKVIKSKMASIILQGTSLSLYVLLCFTDIPYMIECGFYLFVILSAVLTLIWFILICFTRKIEKAMLTKYNRIITIIPAVILAIFTMALFENGGTDFCNYQLARYLYKIGAYESSNAYFLYLDDYKDSATLFKQSKLSEIKHSDNMDEIRLGHWVIGNSVYDNSNYDLWYIITKENNKVLVMKQYSVDVPNNENLEKGWANSSIRKFLNNEYYEMSFSEYIKERIVPTQLTSDSVETTDKIFLLSKEEMETYFPLLDDRDRLFISGVRLRDSNDAMLSTGMFADADTADVNGDGRITFSDYYRRQEQENYIPAMWIDISGIED